MNFQGRYQIPSEFHHTYIWWVLFCCKIRADRAVFTRLLVASRNRTDIDLNDCLSKYEFSAMPLSMFNLGGTMILPENKSKLVKILEDQQSPYPEDETEIEPSGTMSDQTSTRPYYAVAALDGMAEVQKLKKTLNMNTCRNLATEFCNKIEPTLYKYDETHLVFDTYLENSLKNSM